MTMRSVFLAFVFVFVAVVAQGQTVIVRGPAAITAQDHATIIARRGSLVHSQCSQTEGIGFSAVSPDDAIRRCCFWGKRKAREIGVARGSRGWYAVVRYY
jgi:hypothetical protein